MSYVRLCTLLSAFLPLLVSVPARADGVSAIKACEADTDRPEDTARLTLLPNGESRGSDTAADLIKMARQKPKKAKTKTQSSGPRSAIFPIQKSRRPLSATALLCYST
jgi:hypothetical protein